MLVNGLSFVALYKASVPKRQQCIAKTTNINNALSNHHVLHVLNASCVFPNDIRINRTASDNEMGKNIYMFFSFHGSTCIAFCYPWPHGGSMSHHINPRVSNHWRASPDSLRVGHNRYMDCICSMA